MPRALPDRELHEQALLADEDAQRVEQLGPLQVGFREVRVRERRESKVDERPVERLTAETARGRADRRVLYQTFHGGFFDAHCSSSTILSRRLSMFCQ